MNGVSTFVPDYKVYGIYRYRVCLFGPPPSPPPPPHPVGTVGTSVADQDPPDPHVFGPSGSIIQRYGSGSFYHYAKILRKILIPTI